MPEESGPPASAPPLKAPLPYDVTLPEDAPLGVTVGELFCDEAERAVVLQGGVGHLNPAFVYPEFAARAGAQGVVWIRFVVSSLGYPSAWTVQRSPQQALSDESLRVLRGAALTFNPGEQAGQPVEMTCALPVRFRLP